MEQASIDRRRGINPAHSEDQKEAEALMERLLQASSNPDVTLIHICHAYENMMAKHATLGGKLRHLRQRRGQTLSQVAEMAGVKQEEWSGWEANFNPPSPNQLRQLQQDWPISEGLCDHFLELREELIYSQLLKLTHFSMESYQVFQEPRYAPPWQCLNESLRASVTNSLHQRGLEAPDDLEQFASEFKTPQERELWVQDILASQ